MTKKKPTTVERATVTNAMALPFTRSEPGNARSAEKYFEQATAAFRSVAEVSDDKTTVVQMVAFSDPSSQLPEYLEMLENVGLSEKKASRFANTKDGRIWRSVPNRKWYASQSEQSGSGSEVVLFHRKKRR